MVLTTGFARVTQDAILAALGWKDLVGLTLCPADAGGRGRPYPDMVLGAFLRTGAVDDVRQIVVAGDTSYDMLSGVRAGAFGGQEPAMEYLRKLQANNVGPSSSTSKLAPKVDKGELLVANGDLQMNFAQSKSMPNLGIWFPAKDGGRPTTFALPYAAGLVTDAPHTANGKKLLDFMLARQAQQQVSEIGGGFPAHKDVKPVDANAIELAQLLEGVEVFEPDWKSIDKNLPSYIDAWKSATSS